MSPADGSGAAVILERALILVQGSRNGRVTLELLLRAGISAFVCADVSELCVEIEKGGAAALVAEEMLTPDSVAQIATVLERQPPWSDFPIVVFSAGPDSPHTPEDLASVLGNATFLDRPVRTRSMLACVRAAIRSRRRQYEGRRAIELRDTFLAMLGHELRNPLGAIRLAVSLLDQNTPEGGRPRAHGIIDRQSKHLTRLVDDLLDVARVRHGKVTLQREPLNLVEVVRNAYETLDARAHENRLAYDFVCADAELLIDGDRQRLEQIFTNLLTNAIKYTPRGGEVTLSVHTENDCVVVTVRDSGIGIAREMLDDVFEVFAQAKHSLDRTEGGMGLGLAVVRSLVQLHKGTVEAFSQGPGQGSTFIVRLPLLVGIATEAKSAIRALEKPPSARRVVVVEDSPDIRELLTELLKRGGHEVLCEEDGPRGLQTILTYMPDIAFVDLGLPGFDGLELARRARASGSTSRLVAVTGYGQQEDRRDAFDAGFDDHLTKPVVDNDLSKALRRLDSR